VKRPAFVLFIIFNFLTISLAPAITLCNETTMESQQILLVQSNAAQDNILMAGCNNESSCNDFCHIYTHIANFMSHTAPLIINNSLENIVIRDDAFHSLNFAPPVKPPQV